MKSLPIDIWVSIAEYLSCSQNPLLYLSLVNREFNAVFTSPDYLLTQCVSFNQNDLVRLQQQHQKHVDDAQPGKSKKQSLLNFMRRQFTGHLKIETQLAKPSNISSLRSNIALQCMVDVLQTLLGSKIRNFSWDDVSIARSARRLGHAYKKNIALWEWTEERDTRKRQRSWRDTGERICRNEGSDHQCHHNIIPADESPSPHNQPVIFPNRIDSNTKQSQCSFIALIEYLNICWYHLKMLLMQKKKLQVLSLRGIIFTEMHNSEQSNIENNNYDSLTISFPMLTYFNYSRLRVLESSGSLKSMRTLWKTLSSSSLQLESLSLRVHYDDNINGINKPFFKSFTTFFKLDNFKLIWVADALSLNECINRIHAPNLKSFHFEKLTRSSSRDESLVLSAILEFLQRTLSLEYLHIRIHGHPLTAISKRILLNKLTVVIATEFLLNKLIISGCSFPNLKLWHYQPGGILTDDNPVHIPLSIEDRFVRTDLQLQKGLTYNDYKYHLLSNRLIIAISEEDLNRKASFNYKTIVRHSPIHDIKFLLIQ